VPESYPMARFGINLHTYQWATEFSENIEFWDLKEKFTRFVETWEKYDSLSTTVHVQTEEFKCSSRGNLLKDIDNKTIRS
jgi:hypothetical protein